MRYALLALLLSLSAPSFSQMKTDTAGYVRMIERFARFYNAGNIDSLCTLFRDKGDGCIWEKMELPYPDYGRIESFKFVGMDESMAYGRVAVFKVIHQKKGVKAMTFNTHGDMFYTFSFNDTSNEIVKMVESK